MRKTALDSVSDQALSFLKNKSKGAEFGDKCQIISDDMDNIKILVGLGFPVHQFICRKINVVFVHFNSIAKFYFVPPSMPAIQREASKAQGCSPGSTSQIAEGSKSC